MLKRSIASLFFISTLATSVGAVTADFKGPLDLPARINVKLAQSSRLTATVSTGDGLVAVGPRGHILLSKDGGKGWEQVAVPVSSDLVAVQFINSRQGWVVGHDGVVLHTADGGKSWLKQLDGKQAAAAVAQSLKQGLEAGNKDAVAREADLARFVDEGADKPFLDVRFLDEKQGFVVGAFGALFRTVDGGKTWEPLILNQENPSFLHLYAITTHAGSLFVAGERGLMMRWDAEANRFVAVPTPYEGSYFGLLSTQEGLVAYGLRGNAYLTPDNGQNWTRLETPGADSVVSGSVLSDGRPVFVTRGGKVLVKQPGKSRLVAVPAKHQMTYTGVAAFGDKMIVATGSRGVRVETIGEQPAVEK